MIFKKGLLLLKLLLVLAILTTLQPIPIDADVMSEEETPIFTKYGREIGLSNMSISSIVQDKNGFMWFGTQGGLNMYDSNSMKVYSHDPFSEDFLLNNLIQTMFYDEEEHVIWIGTYQGVSKFDIDSQTFENYTVEKDGLSDPVVVAITKDNNNNIWIGTLAGLNKLNLETNQIETFEVEGDVIRDLAFTSTGELLIGTYQGLCMFNFTNNQVEHVETDLPSNYVMVIEEYEEGTLTMGLWAGGVVVMDLLTYEIIDTILETENVYSLTKTEDDYLFMGTWGNGLFIQSEYGITHIETTESDSGIGHPIIYSLFQDDNGLVWIGTNGGGLFLLNLNKSNKVILSHQTDDDTSLSLGKVNSINKFDDLFYFAIYNEGLNVYDPLTEDLIHYKNIEGDNTSLSNNNISEIIVLSDTELLVGTNGGIDLFDMVTKEFSKTNIVPDTYIVYALYKDGNNLWIGTYSNGVFLYNLETESLEEITLTSDSPGLSNSLINDIFIDSSNRIWIGTNNGLNVFKQEGDSFTNEAYYKQGYDENFLGSNIIKIIYQDDNDVVWIGTNGGGLSKYNEDGSFTTYTKRDGLANNIVLGITSDTMGNLWIGTQNGISKFDIDKEIFFNFTLDDGIGGLDISSNLYNDAGDIYFGGIHGITKVNELYSPQGTSNSRVYILDVKVLEESLDRDLQVFNGQKETFDYDHNSIGFEYNSLNFNDTDNIRISYMLDGFDKSFIEGDEGGYVHYSNLPPGTYTFFVKAVNEADDQEEVAQFEFTILKPWHQTNFAYLLYIVSIGIIGYLVFRFYISIIFKAKNEELSKLNSQLEKISIIDPLTTAYNRRHFDKNFSDLFNISVRSKLSLSMMLFDLDDFKLINDNYGHIQGDEILKVIASRAGNVIKRKTDFIARIGGDEFVVVFHDTTKEAAFVLASKIKQEIELPIGREEIVIKISCGLVSMIPDATTKESDFMELVDKELYKSKSLGKGIISVYQKE